MRLLGQDGTTAGAVGERSKTRHVCGDGQTRRVRGFNRGDFWIWIQQFTFYSEIHMTFLVDYCLEVLGFGFFALVSNTIGLCCDSGSLDSFGPATVFSTLEGFPFASSVGGCCVCTSVVLGNPYSLVPITPITRSTYV